MSNHEQLLQQHSNLVIAHSAAMNELEDKHNKIIELAAEVKVLHRLLASKDDELKKMTKENIMLKVNNENKESENNETARLRVADIGSETLSKRSVRIFKSQPVPEPRDKAKVTVRIRSRSRSRDRYEKPSDDIERILFRGQIDVHIIEGYLRHDKRDKIRIFLRQYKIPCRKNCGFALCRCKSVACFLICKSVMRAMVNVIHDYAFWVQNKKICDVILGEKRGGQGFVAVVGRQHFWISRPFAV